MELFGLVLVLVLVRQSELSQAAVAPDIPGERLLNDGVSFRRIHPVENRWHQMARWPTSGQHCDE